MSGGNDRLQQSPADKNLTQAKPSDKQASLWRAFLVLFGLVAISLAVALILMWVGEKLGSVTYESNKLSFVLIGTPAVFVILLLVLLYAYRRLLSDFAQMASNILSLFTSLFSR